jgi:PAS domain-containing protein
VQSIQYRDSDGAMQTWSSANWRLFRRTANRAEIIRTYDEVWPTVRPELDSIQITALAGYPSENSPEGADGVPRSIKQAILLMVGDMYEHREEKITGTIVTENKTLHALLHPHRVEIV